ncbi:PAS domain-containing sensor histidine kinase [Kiloniella litopenaei]|uniref:PAS domain-containing sensor histidine kinase n=1 Tax=Kiloniella litopenaei TaxID=1549748 RepID=UPI000695DD1A|nr:PAS domain-containing sensor histidine kinase [Kiloniella litopenaei]
MLAINEIKSLTPEKVSTNGSCESLVNNCPYGMYRADSDGYFSAVNPSYAQLFGLNTVEEFYQYIQSPDCQLYTDPDLRKNLYNQLKQQNQLSQIVYQIYRIDGTTRWVKEHCIALRDTHGSIIAFEGYVEPMGNQGDTIETSSLPEARFRAIFDQIENIAVQGYDHNRQVIYWNNASTKLYGYTENEALGEKLEDLIIPDEMRNHVITVHQDWLAKNIPIPSGEMSLRNKNGDQIPVYSSHVMLLNSHQEHEMYCIDVELTEIKKVERALRIAKEHAESANMAKTAFLSAMTHELRTPLNAIIGFSEVMEQKIFGDLGHPRYREYVSDIHNSGSHLLGIINDILDLSMIESGELNLKKTDVCLRTAIAHTLQITQRKAINTGISLQTNVPKDIPRIHIDERSLKQILLNLLSNALKFTDNQGRVTITATYSLKDGFHIRIEDTGIGMNEAEIRIALRPFTQVDNSIERKYEGTGLGLPLSRSLTVINGGNLKLTSVKGKGTTVVLHFPADMTV